MRLTRKIGILLACIFGASTWLYTSNILVPAEKAAAVIHGTPRGNLSDLYPRWLGSRELLLHHQDPYSPEITREIQTGYYGRPLSANNPNDPTDQQEFAYPAYLVFFLAPTIHLPFPSVQQGYKWLLIILTSVSIFLWATFLGWTPKKSTIFMAVILTLGSLPAVQGIKLQQLSLLVGFLLAVCFFLVSRGYLALAGIVLGAATIKPQLACLPVILIMAWSAHDWKNRHTLVWSFAGMITLLCAGAELILPGWIGEFWNALLAYQQYTHSAPLLGWIFTPFIGNILSLPLLLLGAVICWPLLRQSAQSLAFAMAASLTLALTVVVVPMVAAYNQILLLSAVLLLVRDANSLWRKGLPVKLLLVVTICALIWPWVLSSCLLLVSVFSVDTARNHWHLPFGSAFVFPLILFALIALHVFQSAKLQRNQ